MTMSAPRPAARWLTIAVMALVAGAALGALGWMRQPQQFFYSYLVAWLFWTGLSLGSLSLLLLHNLTGGKWGDAIRPLLRAAANALPLMGLLVLPIVLAPERLYPWADPYPIEHDPILQHKQRYLNVESFQIRAAVYFAVWLLLLVLLAWQARVAPPPESAADRRFRRLSGQGLALHGLAVTFAAVDWMMSLEPHWFSTIYGVLVFASHGLAALCLAIVLLACANPPPSQGGARGGIEDAPIETIADALHDLGKLLLGFTMLWAYLAFSQFFIIWYGNLPEEVVWYLKRAEGLWLWLAVAVAMFHFVVPFALLLSRQLKRNPRGLGAVAALVLAMHWGDTVWMVEPAVERARESTFIPWLDAGLTLAIGGLWMGAFTLLAPRAAEDSTSPGERSARHG